MLVLLILGRKTYVIEGKEDARLVHKKVEIQCKTKYCDSMYRDNTESTVIQAQVLKNLAECWVSGNKKKKRHQLE